MNKKVNSLEHVIDSLDVETFIACQTEEEGKRLGIDMLKSFGFKDVDVVFIEFLGSGARIRLRANIYKPGDCYGWLNFEKQKE